MTHSSKAADAHRRDSKILTCFVQVYCREHRHVQGGELCPACRELLTYALDRLEKCPFDPKPKCKDCKVHCYQGSYRQSIGEVMRFSGLYFAKRGRLDWLFRYFLR